MKQCLLLVAGLLLSAELFAAIAVDSVSAVQVNFTTTVGWNHTSSGSERLVLVGCGVASAGPTPASPPTYGGTNMVLVGSKRRTAWNGWSFIYKLVAPATGSQAISITWANANPPSTCGSISFTGVDQTTPTGTYASADGSSATPSVNVVGAVGDIIFDAVWFGSSPSGVGAGQTQRWANNDGTGFQGSTEPGAASVTMSWTISSDNWASGGVAVKASAAVARRVFVVN